MWFRHVIASLWTLVILVLCWFPRMYLPVKENARRPFLFPHFDKLVHFGIFAIFAYLWMWATPKVRKVLAFGLTLAVLSELGQELPIVSRDATWLDGVADVAGVLAGVAAYLFQARRVSGTTDSGTSSVRTPSAETP